MKIQADYPKIVKCVAFVLLVYFAFAAVDQVGFESPAK